MQETIRKLLVLQKHDLQILDLDRREKELQERLATEQREFDEQIAELEAERDRLMHLQAALKELDIENGRLKTSSSRPVRLSMANWPGANSSAFSPASAKSSRNNPEETATLAVTTA